MTLFHPTSATQLNLGLAILRIVLGITFAVHGAQKLFVFGLDGVSAGFAQSGIPLPGVVGPSVALVEFFGGLALIMGLLTRLAGFGLAIVMLGAALLVHFSAGFFLPNGYEFAFVLFGAAATLAVTGGGAFSLDAIVAGRRPTPARA
ncbi:MAG TPA: DoxX family protein [Gemmatimonadaceae bacterium]|nr:DoxX family protein [Gemmatimonadaceae bacterium]